MQNNETLTNAIDYAEIKQPEWTLGNVLKAMRISRGETQASLAKKLGTCRQHVQKWEYDDIKPSSKRLKRILQVLRFTGCFKIVWDFYVNK